MIELRDSVNDGFIYMNKLMKNSNENEQIAQLEPETCAPQFNLIGSDSIFT